MNARVGVAIALFALFSGPVTALPFSSRSAWPLASVCGTPALRKYLLTMMSVASWLQPSGTRASSIWKTTDPSGLVILEVRATQAVVAKGEVLACVNLREIFMMRLSGQGVNAWK